MIALTLIHVCGSVRTPHKGTLTIFYGWRFLWWAKIRPDKKKKNWLFSFFLFSPPTLTSKHILFFIFFSPKSQKTPCRDRSTVKYSEPALTSPWGILWGEAIMLWRTRSISTLQLQVWSNLSKSHDPYCENLDPLPWVHVSLNLICIRVYHSGSAQLLYDCNCILQTSSSSCIVHHMP